MDFRWLNQGRVEFAATDLAIHTRTLVPAAVASPGTLCVNAHALENAIKSMPRGTLDLESTDAKITLRGGRRSVDLLGLPGADYPALVDLPTEWQSLPARVLHDLLNRVSFAMCHDITRAHLNGAYLTSEDGKLHAIATDGHRLALARSTHDVPGLKVLVPARLVEEIEKLLGAVEAATIEFAIVRTVIFFRVGDAVLGGALFDGAFPAWQQVVPAGQANRARVSRGSLLESVQAVGKISADRTAGITMHARPGEIELIANNPDRGEAKDVVDAELDGGEVRLGINGKYLGEALASSEDEDVFIEMGSELDPVVIRPADTDGQLCVIMPSRLK